MRTIPFINTASANIKFLSFTDLATQNPLHGITMNSSSLKELKRTWAEHSPKHIMTMPLTMIDWFGSPRLLHGLHCQTVCFYSQFFFSRFSLEASELHKPVCGATLPSLTLRFHPRSTGLVFFSQCVARWPVTGQGFQNTN